MTKAHFAGDTLDDVMKDVVEEIIKSGQPISPTRGDALELSGVLLEIEKPRSRLSRTETRGKTFSCLGELCWYLAKSNDVEFISYYIKKYRDCEEDGVIFGGYGPRFFGWEGLNQLGNIKNVLTNGIHSRKAVVQLFDAHDICEPHKDVPCTCTLQFLVRQDRLHLITSMRSNDAYLGLPHDVFCFTMIQEITARILSVKLGTYKHFVGSLHVYDSDREAATNFISEGWQSTMHPMPPMPCGDPRPAISSFLRKEKEIRLSGPGHVSEESDLDPYWEDLVRLLEVFRLGKERKVREIEEVRGRMVSDIYDAFIEKKLQSLC